MCGLKIAVMSDIHGNQVAFEKCIAYALSENIKTFIFLGDYLGEFPYPQRTMDLLYILREKFDCYFVRGNKEEYWINRRNNVNCGWKDGNEGVGAMKYCFENLTQNDICFFEQMPISQVLRFGSYDSIMICHGTPNSNREKMICSDENSERILDNSEQKIILCGHTHRQGMVCKGNKCALNPGSVGMSLNCGGKAQFMILEATDAGWKHEFISIPYDIEKEIQDIYSSGLFERAPIWCQITEHIMRTGQGSHGEILNEAMKLNGYKDTWYSIPHVYWQAAMKAVMLG